VLWIFIAIKNPSSSVLTEGIAGRRKIEGKYRVLGEKGFDFHEVHHKSDNNCLESESLSLRHGSSVFWTNAGKGSRDTEI
jgi:hypothetical protein